MAQPVAPEYCKDIQDMISFLIKCCKNTPENYNELHDLLEGSDLFFNSENTQELGEDLILCCIEILLDKLRLIPYVEETLWNSIHKLVDLIVHIALTHDSKELDPCARYLQLFDDFSRLMLTIVDDKDYLDFPFELFHFRYNYSKCSHLLPLPAYEPLQMHSNADIHSIFLHAIRISRVHYRITKLHRHNSPLMYSMVSIRQLWEEVAVSNIHQSTELLYLATSVCAAEFSPRNLSQSPQTDELLDLLSMLTGQQIHLHYQQWEQSTFYARWLRAVSGALAVFKLALTELDSDKDSVFFYQFSTHLFNSFISEYPTLLSPPPSSISTTLSPLLHDALLLSDSVSLSILLLVDKWHRSTPLNSHDQMSPVLAALFVSYSRFRESNTQGFPDRAFELLTKMASHHLYELDNCLQSFGIFNNEQLESMTRNLTVIHILLDTCLRLTATSFQPRFTADTEERDAVTSQTHQLLETNEVNTFCLLVEGRLNAFPDALIPQFNSLPSPVRLTLLKACECLASLVCISSKIHSEPSQISTTAQLLFRCLHTLMDSTMDAELRQEDSIRICYLLQLLAASEQKPREVGLMYRRLIPPVDSTSPLLMLALTSCLPIILYSLPHQEADKVVDHFSAVLKNCVLSGEQNLDFSQKLVSLLPILISVISYPSLCKVHTHLDPSHSSLPMHTSFYSLTFPRVPHSSLGHFPQQADDFLKLVVPLLCKKDFHGSTQLEILLALFELATFLPDRNTFIPTVMKSTLLSAGYAVAFQLARPLSDLLQQINSNVSFWSNKKKGWTLLDHPAIRHLVEGLRQVLYSTSSGTVGTEQKTLAVEFFSNLVLSLNGLGCVEEAISIFKMLLQCLFIKDVQEIVSEKINQILTGIGENETTADPKWFESAFGSIPEFLAHRIFHKEQNPEKLTNFLTALSVAFGCDSIKKLFEMMLSRLIPLILKLPLDDDKKETLLQFISSHTDTSVSDLIEPNLSNIFPDLAVNAPDDLSLRIQFLQRHCNDLSGSLRLVSDDIMNKLVLNYSLNPEAINDGFQLFQSIVCPAHSPPIQMMQHIGMEFLGMLKCLEILNNKSSNDQQLVFIKSLNSLIQQLDPRYINVAPHKLMASLTYFLHHRDEEIVKASSEAWESFTAHLELANTDPIWLHIVVTLHQFICNEPIGLIFLPLYKNLISNPELCNTASYLCSVLPASASSHEGLRNTFQEFRDKTDNLLLTTRLQHIHLGLTHHALIVRKLALDALIHLIEKEKSEISLLTLSVPFADRVIDSLVRTLVGLFEVKQEEFNIQLARCLGALGAVDPVRLNIEREREDTSQLPICFEIASSENCAILLLTELTKCLATTTDQTEDQDLVSFVIQQVLAAYRMSDADSQMRMYVEGRINKHMWTVIQPYLNSRYIYCEEKSTSVNLGDSIYSSSSSSATQSDPVYLTEKTKTYNHWLSRVCKKLIPYVTLPSAILIFQSCTRLVAQINPRIGFMLLPHMIVQIMEDKEFDLTQLTPILELILREFKAVMDVALSEFDQPSLTQMEANHLKLIIQTILSVLNFLRQLVRKHKPILSEEKICSLTYLSNQLSTLQLADLADYCNSFPLALRYLEQHVIEERGGQLDSVLLKRLGLIFQHLGDQDSILGLKALRHDLPGLEEAILENLYENNVSGVTTLYKEGISRETENTSLRLGLIETQLDLGFLSDAGLHLEHVMGQQPEWRTEFLPLQVEACWKLSQWDELDSFVRTDNGSLLDVESTPEYIGSARWKLGLGMLLSAAQRHDESEFVKMLHVLRHQRASILVATHTANSLLNDECYQELVRLCMLHEVEQGVKTFIFSSDRSNSDESTSLTDAQKSLLQTWNDSLSMSKACYKAREPILSLRRGILQLSALPSILEEVAMCDLKVAKLSRRCDLQEPGEAVLLKVDHFHPTQLLWLQANHEKAKFISKFGDGQLSAVRYLEKILKLAEEVSDQIPSDTLLKWRHFFSKLKLQHLNLLIDTHYYDYRTILSMLNKLVTDFPDNLKFLFTLAEFCYNLSTDVYKKCEKSAEYELRHSIILECLTHYFNIIIRSSKSMRTIMPKAISLWLEYSIAVVDLSTKFPNFSHQLHSKVDNFFSQLQPYHLYCAYSVLISRITQTNRQTFRLQAKMIVSVMIEYPSVCIWMLIGDSYSRDAVCSSRIKSILDINNFAQLPMDANARIQQIRSATESLIIMIQKFPKIPNNNNSAERAEAQRSIITNRGLLSKWNRELLNVFNDHNLRYKIVLPSDHCFQSPINSPLLPHKDLPTIVKCLDYCMCYNTLKLPKRIRVLASDGKEYDFLYKSGEDIRQDQHIMEIFFLMNLLMKKDPQCSERNLYIRTYAATPFSQTSGLLEWVYNRIPIKDILFLLYAHADQPITKRDFNAVINKNERQHRRINEILLKRCTPAVFHKWFFDEFPNPTDWYLARKEYTRSTALMSMVGYIIGLGDRHPENLLISTRTGHVMHVDLGCLFGEGKYLTVSEVVPYRLTHNMTDGMGVMNFEGNFRITCEAVLKCYRSEYKTLYPILHNINIDLPPNPHRPERKVCMSEVHSRLKGFAEDQKTILPVEGQVASTILEAIKYENLVKMFHGWCAWF